MVVTKLLLLSALMGAAFALKCLSCFEYTVVGSTAKAIGENVKCSESVSKECQDDVKTCVSISFVFTDLSAAGLGLNKMCLNKKTDSLEEWCTENIGGNLPKGSSGVTCTNVYCSTDDCNTDVNSALTYGLSMFVLSTTVFLIGI